MNNDTELLRRYVADRSDSAFSSLVAVYLGLVYATALRELGGDSHRASDVAQLVFTTFAQKASALIGHPTLAGWLHHTTRHIAQKTIRAEQRRAARETEAYAMEEIHRAEESADWKEIQPVIDWALERLDHRDKEAVLRRFFRGQSFAEIGTALVSTEPAARMRVERALHKLRTALARRGIASTSAALSAALTTHGAIAAPAGLATAVSAAATNIAPAGGLLGLVTFMSINKVATSAVAILICAGLAGILVQQRTHAQLERQFARAPGTKTEPPAVEQPPAPDQRAVPDLAALRARLKELTAQTARAIPPSAPSVGFVPSAAWKAAGYSTPGDAFETLMAARVSLDVAALGRSITLTPSDRELAEKTLQGLSADAKAKLALTTPEELVALGWAVGRETRPARVARILAGGTGDEIELRVEEPTDGDGPRMIRYRMQRVGTDWRWAIRPGEVAGALQFLNKSKK